MKYKVGDRVRVIDPYSGGNFDDGDIVTIECIGCVDDDNCYGAISPHDNIMWYLDEDEVGPITNGDRIRAMSDEELVNVVPCPLGFSMFRCPIERQCGNCKREWLKKSAEE